MRNKLVASIMLLVFSLSMLTLAIDIQSVGASGTIYIMPDGSARDVAIDKDG